MQRRSFLKLSAISFTSLLGHAGCKDGSSGEGGEDGGEREIVDAPERFPQSVASGDPKPQSVVLWTRVEDPDLPDEDYEVELEIWELDDATDPPPPPAVVAVVAEARFDHCVKVRVEGLRPGIEHGYRFSLIDGNTAYRSREGRTKTAPAPDADVPVRFGIVTCQDYGGRYYNTYAALGTLHATEPLDLFVHLGDYIYETAGDSSFQDATGDRRVEFDDQAGALMLTSGDGSPYYAARSLDNYRQLYRLFRSDPALTAIHEQLPMVAIWDDHEFSNDYHGITATYLDGREDEADAARRAAANQAWFEYMPVDYPDPEFVYDPATPPPNDIRIYRDLEFGQHVHLVMTDLRSYRPDHLVPEDAYPGAMALDEAQLLTVITDTTPGVPYVDIDAYDGGSYAEPLRAAAQAAGYDPARITGNVSAEWINDVLAQTGGSVPPIIDAAQLDTLPRGIAFHQMFKTSYYGSFGSRYFIVRDPFLWYASYRQGESSGAAQRIMGQDQQDWFLGTMRGSSHTWKLWGNEFCLTGLSIDLSASALPEPFDQAFFMSGEDWNGAPHNRAELIDALADVDNVVALTGDIHAFFAGTPFAWAGAAEGNRVVELVTGAVSSTTYRTILVRSVAASESLSSVPGIGAFAEGIRDLLMGGANPNMGFCEPTMHGFSVVTASATELLVDFHMLAEDEVTRDRYDDPGLADDFTVEHFRVQAGSRDLYRDMDGAWMRWDPTIQRWV